MPVIAYNKEMVEEEITSYNDLLNEKFKEEIVLLDDERIVIGMAMLATGHDMNSVSEIALKDATNYLLSIKKNIKAFDSDSPKSFLLTKEASIAFLWNAEAALAIDENPNIEVVFPKEGSAISMDNMVLLDGAKNKENAYRFIDYILRSDVMKKIIEGYPYKNLNKETDKLLGKSYKNNIASNIPDNMIENGQFVKNIGEGIRKYDEIWTKIK